MENDSGHFKTTSAEVTPNGSLVREFPKMAQMTGQRNISAPYELTIKPPLTNKGFK